MDTWWIDEPVILGSCNPSTDDLEELHARGFRVIVSLLREEEQSPGYDLSRTAALGYTRWNLPVRDFHPPSVAQLLEFVDFLLGSPKAKVLVHCQAGVGRTGTFAAAYWIAKGLSPTEAVARIRQARPGAVETAEQVAVLEEFAKVRSAQDDPSKKGSA